MLALSQQYTLGPRFFVEPRRRPYTYELSYDIRALCEVRIYVLCYFFYRFKAYRDEEICTAAANPTFLRSVENMGGKHLMRSNRTKVTYYYYMEARNKFESFLLLCLRRHVC